MGLSTENDLQIFIRRGIPYRRCLSFIFQHENDPEHTSSAVKAYLGRKHLHNGTLSIMDWPPQSPDNNIIDTVWDHLDRKQLKSQPASKDECFLFVY